MSTAAGARPQTDAAPAPDPAAVWRQLLALDVERLGLLSRDPRLDKAARAALRPLLFQVWQLLTPPQGADDPAAELADDPGAPPADDAGEDDPSAVAAAAERALAELRAAARQCEEALRRCGDDRGAGARRLAEVRIQRPLPERVQVPPSARQTAALAERVVRHFKARLALTEARLKWFEDRANSQAPTSVAQVRQPEGDKDRLGLELLHKRGSSRYS